MHIYPTQLLLAAEFSRPVFVSLDIRHSPSVRHCMIVYQKYHPPSMAPVNAEPPGADLFNQLMIVIAPYVGDHFRDARLTQNKPMLLHHNLSSKRPSLIHHASLLSMPSPQPPL